MLEGRKKELLRAMHASRLVIKLAFRYYALAGVSQARAPVLATPRRAPTSSRLTSPDLALVSQVDDDPNTMSMVQAPPPLSPHPPAPTPRSPSSGPWAQTLTSDQDHVRGHTRRRLLR